MGLEIECEPKCQGVYVMVRPEADWELRSPWSYELLMRSLGRDVMRWTQGVALTRCPPRQHKMTRWGVPSARMGRS